MDEFAQTRGGDDLFDDDFTPILEPVTHSNESTPLSKPQTTSRSGHHAIARGRGNRHTDNFPQRSGAPSTDSTTPGTTQDSVSTDQNDNNAYVQEDSRHKSNQAQPRANAAVRGDRTATGGTPKPKLTEEELSARLAAVKLNNAKRAEAHRLAEADEASFQQREALASKRRREEGQARRQMYQEREKNRLRKLGAQAGREWDEGKEDSNTLEERGSQYRRGAYGGVNYSNGRGRGGRSEHQNGGYESGLQEGRGGVRSRGRGRGDRGRGNRGRGAPNPTESIVQSPPDPINDFPALPSAPVSKQKFGPAPKEEQPFSPALDVASWADEVAAKATSER